MAKSGKRKQNLKGQSKITVNAKGSLSIIKPKAVISTSSSDISVSARDAEDVEHLYIYNDSTNSAVISDCIADDLGISPEPSYQEQVFQGIEQVKGKYVEEFEFQLGPLFKFKIKRAPATIIKLFRTKKDKGKSKK